LLLLRHEAQRYIAETASREVDPMYAVWMAF
jgi:hypothetical protein